MALSDAQMRDFITIDVLTDGSPQRIDTANFPRVESFPKIDHATAGLGVVGTLTRVENFPRL